MTRAAASARQLPQLRQERAGTRQAPILRTGRGHVGATRCNDLLQQRAHARRRTHQTHDLLEGEKPAIRPRGQGGTVNFPKIAPLRIENQGPATINAEGIAPHDRSLWFARTAGTRRAACDGGGREEWRTRIGAVHGESAFL